jgi:hypothetical protein
MSNEQGLGFTMLLGGLVVAGITTLIAVLASKRYGRFLWGMPIPVISLVVFWTLSLVVTIVGIYFLAKPEAGQGNHARISREVRHG